MFNSGNQVFDKRTEKGEEEGRAGGLDAYKEPGKRPEKDAINVS
jgi:hypothetical protein